MINDKIVTENNTTAYGKYGIDTGSHPNYAVRIMVGIRLLVCEFSWIHIYSQLKQLKGIQKPNIPKIRNAKYLRKEDYEQSEMKKKKNNFNIILGSCVPNSLSFITVQKVCRYSSSDIGLEKWKQNEITRCLALGCWLYAFVCICYNLQ